ncbi:MAG TPA: hypothetical protein PKE69_02115 [Pyrinomonadaceae bacterium]|nr:hypothetical protein [Pyrinomonadaceae bacterium]
MQYQSGAVSPVGSISDGWNIIKDSYWIFFGMTLVAFVIILAVSGVLGLINNGITMVIAGALGATTKASSDAAQLSAALVPQIISLVISLFTNIIVLAVTGILACGIYKAIAKKAAGGAADFGDLFSGFEHFQPCLIVGAIMSIIQFVIGMVTLFLGIAFGISALSAGLMTSDGQLNTALISGMIAGILAIAGISLVIQLIVSALTFFIYPLIADRKVSAMESMTTSIKAGFSNIVGIVLLLILLGLMLLGGAFACVIGIFFVAPVIYATVFSAYRSVFGAAQQNYYQTPPPPPNFGNQPGY